MDAACPCNREVLAAGRGTAIAFNVGIELGQLITVAVMVAVVWSAANRLPDWAAARRGAYAAIAVAGSVGAALLVAT